MHLLGSAAPTAFGVRSRSGYTYFVAGAVSITFNSSACKISRSSNRALGAYALESMYAAWPFDKGFAAHECTCVKQLRESEIQESFVRKSSKF